MDLLYSIKILLQACVGVGVAVGEVCLLVGCLEVIHKAESIKALFIVASNVIFEILDIRAASMPSFFERNVESRGEETG